MAQKNGGNFRTDWKFGNEFYCENTGVAVVVNRSSHRIPKYSFKIGRYKIGDEEARGPLVPFIGASVTKEDLTSGILDLSSLQAVMYQLILAQEWAKEDLAYNCTQAKKDAERLARRGSIATETEVPMFNEASSEASSEASAEAA